MINCTPEIVRLPVDTNENLIQVPASIRKRMTMNPALSDFGCKLWTESIPPESYRLVTDVDPTLKQQVLDLPQR